MYWANRNPSSCAYTVLERSEFATSIYAYHHIAMTKMFIVIKAGVDAAFRHRSTPPWGGTSKRGSGHLLSGCVEDGTQEHGGGHERKRGRDTAEDVQEKKGATSRLTICVVDTGTAGPQLGLAQVGQGERGSLARVRAVPL